MNLRLWLALGLAGTFACGTSESGAGGVSDPGRPGGKKTETASELLQRFPERLVEKAVKGMLPKNTLGRHQHKKLKVYAGGEHPHEAQQPAPLEITL